MSTENFEFDEIKFIIKSHVFAAGSSCTERKVRRDYFEETGEKLDDELRKKLGLTFYQFMNKIPDVCRLSKGIDGETIIHRVGNEDAEHLDVLKKGESKPRTKKPGFHVASRSFKPAFIRYNSNSTGYFAQRPSRPQQFNNRPTAFNHQNPASSVRPAYQTRSKTPYSYQTQQQKSNYANNHANNQATLPQVTKSFSNPTPFSKNQDWSWNSNIQNPPLRQQNGIQDQFYNNNINNNVASAANPINSVKSADESQEFMNFTAAMEPRYSQAKSENNSSFDSRDSWYSNIINHCRSQETGLSHANTKAPETQQIDLVETQSADDSFSSRSSSLWSEPSCYWKPVFLTFRPPTTPAVSSSNAPALSQNSAKNMIDDFVTGILSIPNSRLKSSDLSQKMEVKLLNVRSPGTFDLQFNLKMLKSIMDEMLALYSSRVAEQLRVTNVKPGMSVAVEIEGKWYRGEVQMLLAESKVCVKLIDFSENAFVKSENLRYLKKSFCSASRCCTQASLAFVKPTNHPDIYDKEAIELFNKLTKNVDLFASVHGKQNDRFAVTLYLDKIGRLSIANKLILNNFCRQDNESNRSERFVLESETS